MVCYGISRTPLKFIEISTSIDVLVYMVYLLLTLGKIGELIIFSTIVPKTINSALWGGCRKACTNTPNTPKHTKTIWIVFGSQKCAKHTIQKQRARKHSSS